MIDDLGFTGTQKGMTNPQAHQFEAVIRLVSAKRFHHGDCVGSDAQAALIARRNGLFVVGHPPIKDGKRAFFPSDVEWPPRDFLDRNQDIVDVSALLVGTPKDYDWPTNFRGQGTWSTLARARRSGVPFVIITPGGALLPHNCSPSLHRLLESV